MIRTINLNTGEGYTKTVFPDSQPHINIQVADEEFLARVIVSLDSPAKLLELCLVANALDNDKSISKSELHITYLMGARYDRIINKGDSFDLKVIANIINSLEFLDVYLYDPHSDVATALINRSEVVDNKELVQLYDKENAVLIIPDAGAAKKAYEYAKWNSNLVDSIQCNKHRDKKDGRITLQIVEPEKCAGRHCVIIDDICDGGGTFLGIAKSLRDTGWNPLSLTLIVTHGIFSKGFVDLGKYFNQIIFSDSLGVKRLPNAPGFLKQLAYDPNKYGISIG